jgi:glycosyltransferase involved in cell wall biosynthesis
MDVGTAPYSSRPDFYFSPLKLYEYMAAGLAVAASKLGQIAEVIEDGIDGLLCQPDDAAALATALLNLRADPALRRRLASAARQKVLRHNSWDAIALRILSFARTLAMEARA